MWEFLRQHRSRMVVAGLVLLAFVGMGLPRPVSHRVRSALGVVFVPAQAAVSGLVRLLEGLTRPLVLAWRRGGEVGELESRLRRLENQNAQLRQQLAEQDEVLRDLLHLRRSLPAVDLEFVLAPVIGRDSCTWRRTVTIGRGSYAGMETGQLVIGPADRLIAAGSRQGLQPGNAVLDGAFLVGRVVAVGPFHSVVRLITDPDSAMRAQVVGVRGGRPVRIATGILTGSPLGRGLLRLEYVSRRADVRPGDAVLSAGYGGVLPKPVVVGRVRSVEVSPMPLLSEIVVEPSANLSTLRRVIVVRERLPVVPSTEAPLQRESR